MSRSAEYFLAGRWRSGDASHDLIGPADGELVARVALADRAAAATATLRAVDAFETIGRRASSWERAGWLDALRERVAERAEEIATTMAREMGKPVAAARLEVDRCLFTLRDGAEEARRLRGEYLPLDVLEATRGTWGVTRRVPVGPVLAFVPFNFPCNLLAHKLAPALAAGCSIVIKPSPKAPLTPLAMAAAVEAAGVPEGMVSVLPCADEVAGELVDDDRYRLFSFTGSSRVGWQLAARAGRKKLHLELGNNSAAIVHADCPDLEWTARRCAAGGFGAAGQSCISVQRLFAHEAIADELTARLANAAAELVVGDPLDEETVVGPMVDEQSARRVVDWVDEAVEAGAELVRGGTRKGAFVDPTVLRNVPADARVQRQEVFGPVVTVSTYTEIDEAIRGVNDGRLGLQAGIFTRDLGLAEKAWGELVVGAVCVNDYPTFRVDNMPYGGVEDSGLGREGVRYALDAYTEPRLMVVNGSMTAPGGSVSG